MGMFDKIFTSKKREEKDDDLLSDEEYDDEYDEDYEDEEASAEEASVEEEPKVEKREGSLSEEEGNRESYDSDDAYISDEEYVTYKEIPDAKGVISDLIDRLNAIRVKKGEEPFPYGVEDVFAKASSLGLPPFRVIVDIFEMTDEDEAIEIWSELYGIDSRGHITPAPGGRNSWYIKDTDGNLGIMLPSSYWKAKEIAGEGHEVYLVPAYFFEIKDIEEFGYRGNFIRIVKEAHDIGMTDLHFEVKDYGVLVRGRLLGDMVDIETMTHNDGILMQKAVKVMASESTKGLDTEEWRLSQDARIQIERLKLDLRLAFTPSLRDGMQNYVIRLLSKTRSKIRGVEDIKKLGFVGNDANILLSQLHARDGLVIISGATGSGKSKTLNVMLSMVPSEKKALTVEDPVEYELDRAVQHQVSSVSRDGKVYMMDYLAYIREFMRQDPDIMMIGEWRKMPELTEAILYGSETGHLLFTTLHSARVPGVPNLLVNQYGLQGEDIGNNVNAIFNQRLVKTVCPHCKITRRATGEDIANLSRARFVDVGKFERLAGKEVSFANPDGCEYCQVIHPSTKKIVSRGYIGRTLIYEYLLMTREVRAMCRETTSLMDFEDVMSKGIDQHTGERIAKTFVDVSLEKLLAGDCDIKNIATALM